MKISRFLVVLALFTVIGAVAFVWFSKQSRGRALFADTGSTDQKSDDVIDAYKQLEKAVRTGDGKLYLSIQSQKKLAARGPAQAPDGNWLPADPSVRYAVLGVRRRDDLAAVLGKITDSSGGAPQYYLVKFMKENSSWKVADDLIGEQPMDASVLYAAVPPEDGSFIRAGSPWGQLPDAATNPRFTASEIKWNLRATRDESFLYVRFEARIPLPAPNTELSKSDSTPQAPDSMVIKTGTGKQFGLQVADNKTTRATFGEDGRATSNRFFMQYSFSIRNAAHEDLFSEGTGNSIAPLISVERQFVTVKIPLKCLGIDSTDSTIEISEANSIAKILPYRVDRFSNLKMH